MLLCLARGARACQGVSTVDISSYVVNGSDEEKRATREAFDEAMRTIGMACISGHGVALSVIEEAEEAALLFFQSEAKWRFGDAETYGTEGYTGLGVEAVARSAGRTNAPPDVVESFVLKHRPDKSALEEPFLSKATNYWDELTRVFNSLLEVSADILNVDRNIFTSAYGDNDGRALRFAHYPPQTTPTDAKRYGLHTDYLTFTILRATKPGLQVELDDGTLRDVLPQNDTLLVNAADLTELWTNGRWRSAPHQVITHTLPSEDRSSIAFFTGPKDATLITPILQPGEDTTQKFQPVIAGEYLLKKISPTTVHDDDASSSSEENHREL